MPRSTDRILTTHVGSLVRPTHLADEFRMRQRGERIDQARYDRDLAEAVAGVVRTQHETGIDIPSDGEFGKSSFMGYLHNRVSGFEPTDKPNDAQARRGGRLREAYPEFYRGGGGGQGGGIRPGWNETRGAGASGSGGGAGDIPGTQYVVCTSPIRYIGQADLKRDLDNFTAALAKVGKKPQDGAFYAAIAPHNFGRGENRHYKDEDAFVGAVAEALATEYKQIIDAGFDLQIDAPVGMYEQLALTMEEFRRKQQVGIEAMNTALRGLPKEKIRYHICFGSWNAPHTFDPPLEEFVEVILKGHIGQLSVEGSNARHEHEVDVWKQIKLPDDVVLIPGVITHMTYVVEHPRLVAKRIKTYTDLVGRERVIASSDCGPGRVVFDEVQWAKLAALAEGARLATQELWGRTPAMTAG